ncbi:MAG: hypothetical protein JNK85_15475 [Verrucomicrobiales bacterium]|nr:hypothetical protein [Verrucomicrobiales bacterium]
MRSNDQDRSRLDVRAWAAGLLLACGSQAAPGPAVAPTPNPTPPGDDWLPPVPEAAAEESAWPSSDDAARGPFAELRAEIDGLRVKVNWPRTNEVAVASATMVYSVDSPGHWAVRDWRSAAMQRAPGGWTATLPIPCVTIPVVYYLRHTADGITRLSPARVFRPDQAGMEEANPPFTGFLDGFEQGLEGWTGGTGREPEGTLTYSTNAFSGSGALRLQIPQQRSSVAAATVRLRGWMLWEFSPTTLRFAARAPRGSGTLRCSLVSKARTPEIQVHADRREHQVHGSWTRIEIPIAEFAGLRLRDVDWMTIQFFDEPGADLLVDDVELVLP